MLNENAKKWVAALRSAIVQTWLGLASDSGVYNLEDDKDRSLVVDNDSREYTFAQIADTIESDPEGLFV